MWGSNVCGQHCTGCRLGEGGLELQTILEVEDEVQQQGEQDYGSWEEGSWKIGDEIMEEVEEFKYLGVWFDRKLRGNFYLE